MGDEIKIAKDIIALILSMLVLAGILGSAFIARYKTKKLIESEEEREKHASELEEKLMALSGRLDKVEEAKKYLASKSDLALLKERINTNEKTMDTMRDDLEKQTELGTEIRIEISSMHAELKNVAQLLQDLKSCAIYSPSESTPSKP